MVIGRWGTYKHRHGENLKKIINSASRNLIKMIKELVKRNTFIL